MPTSFEKNVQRWSVYCPEPAQIIGDVECFHVKRSLNADGTENLKYSDQERSFFLHSTENPDQEAQEWFSRLNLHQIDVLYIYGIGLGYYYKAVKEWLKASKNHMVVFLEDDLEVLRLFFETKLADELFKDSQARVFFLDWNRKDSLCADIVPHFLFKNFNISALNSYLENKKNYSEVASFISFQSNMRAATLSEYLSHGTGFFANYYQNLLNLPSSYLGNTLFDQFKDIPAIICGAGPSLAKNSNILRKLQDRALIFAGGTAMNAINAGGVIPHFGVGIDPNIYQFTRLVANQAFEVPYFYRNRMHHQAFKTIHGEHLYVTGAGGYILSDWIEEKLGIPTGVILAEGYNVINFSLSIALAMGCNPIFFVGVDLAYTNNRSYAPHILTHAIHDPKKDFRTKTPEEELVIKKDIYGEPIQTLWKWINESIWFSKTRFENLTTRFFNCTEGGLGFSAIPNINLADAAVDLLQKQYDMEGMVHAAIQNSLLPRQLTENHILAVLQELKGALKQCMDLYVKIFHLHDVLKSEIASGKDVPKEYVTDEINHILSELKENPAYQKILQPFEEKYLEYLAPKFKEIDYEIGISSQEVHLRKIELMMQLDYFLFKTAEVNVVCLDGALMKHEEAALFTKPSLQHKTIEDSLKGIYVLENNILVIEDPELGIHYRSQLPADTQLEVLYYPGGFEKSKQYRREGILFGPSIYYHESGSVLSKTWYVEGKKVGKALYYHPDGSLYSVQQFIEGERDGAQEYYYANGERKSILTYSKGIINGPVYLYHPNGKMKRELHYAMGKRDGEERLWSEQGLLLIEAEYDHDKPIRTAREWYENGNLSKELIYDDDHKRCLYRRWDEDGRPWRPEVVVKEDYFDRVSNQTQLLTESISTIVESVKNVSNAMLDEANSNEISLDIQNLESQMEILRKQTKELQFESGGDPENPMEAIWKSDSMQREIQSQLESLSHQMNMEIQSMREIVQKAEKILDNKAKKDLPTYDKDTLNDH